MKYLFQIVILFFVVALSGCTSKQIEPALKLWYTSPATEWTEALPIGNGRIGAMVYGGAALDHIQFNEETLWTGEPREYSREGASGYLNEIRQLLFDGKQAEAEKLASEQFMGRRSNEESYPADLQTWLTSVNQASNQKFAELDFDDSDWETMKFPASEGWERIGFQGLDGAVWLRFSFELPKEWEGKELMLNLGRIRDTDATYLNGKLVGSEENKNAHRRYSVDASIPQKGVNVIAIQVLNFYDKGGLVGFKTDEPMVVYPSGENVENGIPLDVEWKYLIQDNNPPEYPHYQAAYQPFGDLWLAFEGHENPENYRRELDLNEAITRTTYSVDGVQFTKEYFVSAVDQALIVNIKASKKGALNFKVKMNSPHIENAIRQIDNQTLELKAQVKNGALYGVSQLKVDAKNGVVSISDNELSITAADEVTIFLTAATNYVDYQDVSADAAKLASAAMQAIASKDYQSIRIGHVAEYQNYFNRFSIDFGSSENEKLPTDERIKLFSESGDASLAALYVQYGRYLLISSSRPGTRPANLQGIWNDQLTPPWDSKYTININLEMNYWPAEVLNMSEMHEPLFQLIKEIAEQGEKTAKEHYGARGWVLHHNTDLWRATAPINNSNHGIWVTGGAWLCHHLWEHYAFTQDTVFLSEAYPNMKGAALFFNDFLIEDPKTGFLISTPSNSPENGGLVAGPAMDHQIIRDLFANCIASAKVLNRDQAFIDSLAAMLPKIAPSHIGKHGQLQEWLTDIDEPENKHRHVSHLWAVYPGNEINVETPELFSAAKQSLLYRGDEGTGWSLAWKINLWSRFREGNHAWELVKTLIRPASDGVSERGGSYPNLFDAHPPFQIDGNFGASAGIVEMIVQSQGANIVLLPALPDALASGNISGLKARGGFELEISWAKGKLTSLKVLSNSGQKLALKYQEVEFLIDTQVGKLYAFDGALKPL
jgi:alpha-L-fucosidase 2